MTTTQQTEYLITECADHGTKATGDFASAREYVLAAIECDDNESRVGTLAHQADLAHDGLDCWRCCPSMVIDPWGMFDH